MAGNRLEQKGLCQQATTPAHEDQRAMSENDLEADVQIGDFRITRRLGAGGMGVVYLARQVSLDRTVALKVLGNRLTRPQDIARFRREAQAAAKLHHPGIAGIHFIGQDEKLCYMAMEYIDGMALSDIIDRLRQARHPQQSIDSCVRETIGEGHGRGPIRFDAPVATVDYEATPDGNDQTSITPEAKGILPSPGHIRRCCEIVRDAALALGYAHGQGVVHRDIKPGNLMLDRQGQIHIIDFGVARFFEDATITQTGQLVGTPMYMSPEQVTGQLTVDHRSDIYSLGLVLHELLTLRPPIVAETREGVLRKIVSKSLPPISWQNKGIPQSLEGIVHKATAKDSDERYRNAVEFAKDLQNYLDGKQVTANPYRYKFDDREIVAARPGEVTVAGWWTSFNAISSALLALAGFWSAAFDPAYAWHDSLSYIPVSVACFFVGRGILRGKRWARWAGVGLGILYPLLSWLVPIFIYSKEQWATWWKSGTSVYSLSVTVCWLVAMLLLLRRRTGDWMAFAHRLRSEHGQQTTDVA
jgi:serine/threonine protein kinase